jgi:elongation factor G
VSVECVAGVAKGLDDARECGVIAGYPVIDFTATLIDGASHDVEASALAFEIAARRVFLEAIPQAAPRLLEPVMKVEVVTPGEYMTAIAGDLRSRRGKVTDVSRRNDALVIAATTPLASMLGYARTLERLSQGRATFDMRFSHYVSVPPPTDDTPPFGPALGMRA